MGTGEWLVWAGEAGANAPTPIWLTILVALIALGGPWLAYRASNKSTEAVRLSAIEANSTANRAIELHRETAQETNETARHANRLAASKSNRDLILAAMELARSQDPAAKKQGYALLDGLSRMPGLSPDDAILIQELSRPQIEGTLSEGRRTQEQEHQEVVFYVEASEGEEASDEAD